MNLILSKYKLVKNEFDSLKKKAVGQNYTPVCYIHVFSIVSNILLCDLFKCCL